MSALAKLHEKTAWSDAHGNKAEVSVIVDADGADIFWSIYGTAWSVSPVNFTARGARDLAALLNKAADRLEAFQAEKAEAAS